MKLAFYTLGCKVNLFETQAIEQLAVQRGHQVVERDADAVIVNTCTVTAVADRKNLRAIHKLRRDNPDAILAACGCMAEVDSERLHAQNEVDLVCGTKNRSAVLPMVEQAVAQKNGATIKKTPCDSEVPQDDFYLLPAGVPHGRTRALLKIEDGCNYRCSYCIIPKARGAVRSMPPALAISQAKQLAAQGVREIVVTGIELGSYGRDLAPKSSLVDLTEQLLCACPATRFRLSSLDPRVTDEAFCQRLCRYDNLALHFHLSLQSGCDAVLRRMARGYTTALFLQHTRLLRQYFPQCSITTDIIVGFPGESEQQFLQTVAFAKQCAFSDLHVFPFSPRPNTRAAEMEGQIAQQERQRRADALREVGLALRADYLAGFVGTQLTVLPEHQSDGLWAAHGRYGFAVYVQGENICKNRPVAVCLTEPVRDGLLAIPITD